MLILITDSVMLTNFHLGWKREVRLILEERFGVTTPREHPLTKLVVRTSEGAILATFEEDWGAGTFTLAEEGGAGMKLVLHWHEGFTFTDAEGQVARSVELTDARKWLQELVSHLEERLRP